MFSKQHTQPFVVVWCFAGCSNCLGIGQKQGDLRGWSHHLVAGVGANLGVRLLAFMALQRVDYHQLHVLAKKWWNTNFMVQQQTGDAYCCCKTLVEKFCNYWGKKIIWRSVVKSFVLHLLNLSLLIENFLRGIEVFSHATEAGCKRLRFCISGAMD